MSRSITIAVSIILMAYLFSCGTARRSEAVMGPMNITDPAVKKGEVAFMEYCNRCHPGGESGLAPSINDKPLPGFLMRFQIRHGLGVMPAFKKEVVDKEELDNIIAYIKALRKHDEEQAVLK